MLLKNGLKENDLVWILMSCFDGKEMFNFNLIAIIDQ